MKWTSWSVSSMRRRRRERERKRQSRRRQLPLLPQQLRQCNQLVTSACLHYSMYMYVKIFMYGVWDVLNYCFRLHGVWMACTHTQALLSVHLVCQHIHPSEYTKHFPPEPCGLATSSLPVSSAPFSLLVPFVVLSLPTQNQTWKRWNFLQCWQSRDIIISIARAH